MPSKKVYWELRQLGASGGEACVAVNKSGGPDKTNPFTLNKCIGEMKKQVQVSHPNPEHDKAIDKAVNQSKKQATKDIANTFTTRKNFKMKSSFFQMDEGQEALKNTLQELGYEVSNIEVYGARTGSIYIDIKTNDKEFDNIEFRIADHIISPETNKLEKVGTNDWMEGTLQIDYKEGNNPDNEFMYGASLTLMTNRLKYVDRDQIQNTLKTMVEEMKKDNGTLDINNVAEAYNEKYGNEKYQERQKDLKEKARIKREQEQTEYQKIKDKYSKEIENDSFEEMERVLINGYDWEVGDKRQVYLKEYQDKIESFGNEYFDKKYKEAKTLQEIRMLSYKIGQMPYFKNRSEFEKKINSKKDELEAQQEQEIKKREMEKEQEYQKRLPEIIENKFKQKMSKQQLFSFKDFIINKTSGEKQKEYLKRFDKKWQELIQT